MVICCLFLQEPSSYEGPEDVGITLSFILDGSDFNQKFAEKPPGLQIQLNPEFENREEPVVFNPHPLCNDEEIEIQVSFS